MHFSHFSDEGLFNLIIIVICVAVDMDNRDVNKHNFIVPCFYIIDILCHSCKLYIYITAVLARSVRVGISAHLHI